VPVGTGLKHCLLRQVFLLIQLDLYQSGFNIVCADIDLFNYTFSYFLKVHPLDFFGLIVCVAEIIKNASSFFEDSIDFIHLNYPLIFLYLYYY